MGDETCEETFSAEKVIDSGFGQQDGKRYYKVKWVRYTWECEDTVQHLKDLLVDFWAEHEGLLDPTQTYPDPDDDCDDAAELQNDVESDVEDEGAVNATAEDGFVNSEGRTVIETAVHENVYVNDAAGDLLGSANNDDDDITTTITAITSNYSSKHDHVTTTTERPSCDTCFKTFNSMKALKAHTTSQHTQKQFACELCSKKFSERATLKRHMLIHLDNKPFKCEHCERAFSDKSTLRRHIISHSGHKRYQCKLCNKRFTRNEHLRQHNYIHTSEKLFKCETCFKHFRQRSTLKNHMQLHRAEGGLTCDACGVVFTRQTHLDKHAPWCKGVRPNGTKCEFCDERFTDDENLKQHQAMHVNKLQCYYCDESFTDRSSLQVHLLTHGEVGKPFQCTLCLKEFMQKSTLIEHVSNEHSDQLILEILQPSDYCLDGGILIGGGGSDQNVSYVLQNPIPGEDTIDNQRLEVCISNDMNDPAGNDITTDIGPVDNEGLIQETGECSSSNSSFDHEDGQTEQVDGNLALHVDGKGDVQTVDENQLLRVQILRMENGNTIIQSIETIISGEDETEMPPLPVGIACDDLTVGLVPDVNEICEVQFDKMTAEGNEPCNGNTMCSGVQGDT